jgi:hypothetical protein
LGKLSGYKTKIVTNCIEKKLGIDLGQGSERSGWYYIGEKKILRVTVPKEHGGGRPLSTGVAKRVISNL